MCIERLKPTKGNVGVGACSHAVIRDVKHSGIADIG